MALPRRFYSDAMDASSLVDTTIDNDPFHGSDDDEDDFDVPEQVVGEARIRGVFRTIHLHVK